ncbi:MAG: trehalase family glycosidase [Pseudomonadota bacterium]|nr:trehalase family glycosidase [Pseudomonadota bacterium]
MGADKSQFYQHVRAARESGWDFSSRWLANPNSLASIRTTEIIPVDLNALLETLEQTLASALQCGIYSTN